ncbi:hypothetical protein EJ05DRAFT_472503 [Pseudovirgaria hyperparasitica]|uniref:Uncharacterized protein n=1 Tax=Pseudovirgaria hyperparasitica TaxID=470096 RepID=A0A6A6WFK8_9PEZI|nr:uncharacterized protein EJ05DRAFT_472503 [Pseudovirgaria hyperparasitica]KAF2761523.1 hypothetical protein EJ05DRAFT_472503 [Pseudovirgaria hyperparasitica]
MPPRWLWLSSTTTSLSLSLCLSPPFTHSRSILGPSNDTSWSGWASRGLVLLYVSTCFEKQFAVRFVLRQRQRQRQRCGIETIERCGLGQDRMSVW